MALNLQALDDMKRNNRGEILSKAVHLSPTEWQMYHERPAYLSASQCATALGLDPYSSRYELYQRKIGKLPWPEKSIAMRRGHALEPLMAELYEEHTGNKAIDHGDHTIWRHPEHDWLFSTPDRFTDFARDVEFKTSSPYFMAEWKEGVPAHVWVQVQIQMQCCDVTRADVACLVGDTFIIHEVGRTETWFKHYVNTLAEFVSKCLAKKPPSLDHKQDGRVLAQLHPDDTGEALLVPALEPYIHKLLADRKAAKRAEALVKEGETRIKEAMEGYTYLEAGPFTCSWKTVETKPYKVKAKKYRRFSMKEEKKE